jgi:hypothetical protein
MLTKDEAIKATAEGWSQYVRERCPNLTTLAGKLILVEVEATMFIAPMPPERLRELGDTRAECRENAYRFAPLMRSLFA